MSYQIDKIVRCITQNDNAAEEEPRSKMARTYEPFSVAFVVGAVACALLVGGPVVGLPE